MPQAQLRSASALGSISVNVARAVGPAVAGVLIARTGVAPVFGLNAVAFAVFAFALVPSWDEHLRQHGGRLTGEDREAEARARELTDGDPEVRHLVPAAAGPALSDDREGL